MLADKGLRVKGAVCVEERVSLFLSVSRSTSLVSWHREQEKGYPRLPCFYKRVFHSKAGTDYSEDFSTVAGRKPC